MGRPRKPTNVLEASGAFKKNPKRKVDREGEPKCIAPLGGPPEHFCVKRRKLWVDIKTVAPEGILCLADEYVMQCAVNLLYEESVSPGKFTAAQYGVLHKYLGSLGIEAHARTKLKVDGFPSRSKREDEFFD